MDWLSIAAARRIKGAKTIELKVKAAMTMKLAKFARSMIVSLTSQC